MSRWGELPVRWDLLRNHLEVPGRLLVFPPAGLGDFVAWLAFLRPLAERNPNTQFCFAGDSACLPLYRAALGEQAEIARPDAQAAFQLALVLNDDDLSIGEYAGMLARVRQRVGGTGGKRRGRFINRSVAIKRLGRPRHEALRNSRLLLPFGLPPLSRLGDCLPYCRLEGKPAGETGGGRYVVLHVFSNGHAREWPVLRFAILAQRLHASGFRIVLTGTANEHDRLAAAWPRSQRPPGTLDVLGRLELPELLSLLAGAELVVSASTGPLHLAAALGVRSLGLYPRRKGMNLERWMPIGARACGLQLAACPKVKCDNLDCGCMQGLSLELVETVATTWLNSISELPDVSALSAAVEYGSACICHLGNRQDR